MKINLLLILSLINFNLFSSDTNTQNMLEKNYVEKIVEEIDQNNKHLKENFIEELSGKYTMKFLKKLKNFTKNV